MTFCLVFSLSHICFQIIESLAAAINSELEHSVKTTSWERFFRVARVAPSFMTLGNPKKGINWEALCAHLV